VIGGRIIKFIFGNAILKLVQNLGRTKGFLENGAGDSQDGSKNPNPYPSPYP